MIIYTHLRFSSECIRPLLRGWRWVSVEHSWGNGPKLWFPNKEFRKVFGREQPWKKCLFPSRLLISEKCSHGRQWSFVQKSPANKIYFIYRRDFLTTVFEILKCSFRFFFHLSRPPFLPFPVYNQSQNVSVSPWGHHLRSLPSFIHPRNHACTYPLMEHFLDNDCVPSYTLKSVDKDQIKLAWVWTPVPPPFSCGAFSKSCNFLNRIQRVQSVALSTMPAHSKCSL